MTPSTIIQKHKMGAALEEAIRKHTDSHERSMIVGRADRGNSMVDLEYTFPYTLALIRGEFKRIMSG